MLRLGSKSVFFILSSGFLSPEDKVGFFKTFFCGHYANVPQR